MTLINLHSSLTFAGDARPRPALIRDPVHGYVHVPPEVEPIVRTPFVQRLRNISQNSRAIGAYPSLNGSRYEHALGTMELSIKGWWSAWQNTWGRSEEDRLDNVQDTLRTSVERTVKRRLKQSRFGDDLLAQYLRDNRDPAISARWKHDFPSHMANAVGTVGLLHDVGHPPFSHVLEDSFESYANDILGAGSQQSLRYYKKKVGKDKRAQFHEWAGTEILKKILSDEEASRRISKILVWEIFTARAGHNWAAALHGLIDEEIDVDRLDYIRRDAMRAGVEYHAIDTDRLLSNIEIHQLPGRNAEKRWQIGIGQRATSAVESLLLQRDQSYRWMIFHYKAIMCDTALKRAFDIALAKGDPSSRKALDYIGNWSPRGATPGTSFAVDDHAVLVWLRDTVAETDDKDLEPLASYMRICDSFSDEPVPTWRTYGEFRDVVHKYADELQSSLSSGSAEKIERSVGVEEGIIYPRHKAPELQFEIEETQSEELPVRLGEKLKAILIGNTETKVPAHPSFDQELEAILQSEHPSVDGVKGVWMVAHRLKFNAIKKNQLSATLKLWNGTEGETFDALSPIYEGLTKSDIRRPMFWGFFMPEGSHRPTRASVQKAFIEVLAKFLADAMKGGETENGSCSRREAQA